MGLGDLRSDVETKSQTLLTGPVASRVWLEEVCQRLFGDWRAFVGHRQIERSVQGSGYDVDRPTLVTVRNCIPEQVREKLAHLAPIAADGLFDLDR